jgi:hypothetical protein
MYYRGEWFNHACSLVGQVIWHLEHVQSNDGARYNNIFGIGSPIEYQVIAHILLPTLTVIASPARSAIMRNNTHPWLEVPDIRPGFHDLAGQLMPENHGGEEFRMTTFVSLYICSTSRRFAYVDQHIVRSGLRNWQGTVLQLAWSDVYHAMHFIGHFAS